MHMESNRNLSSIISKIRDDGPPAAEATSAPAPHTDYVTPAVRSGRARGGRLWRLLTLLLLCGVVVAAAAFYLLRWYGGALPVWSDWRQDLSGSGELAPATPAASVATGPALDPAVTGLLLAQVDRLQQQLDALGAAVASRDALTDARIAALEQSISGLGDQQRERLDQLQGKLDSLQSRIDSRAANTPASPRPAPPRQAPVTRQPAASAAPATPAAPVEAAADTTPATSSGQAETEEWVVNVASSTVLAQIDEAETRMRRLGISVERQVVDFGGEVRYRLRVSGFPSGLEAKRYAEKMEQEMGIKGAWASRR